MMLLPAALRVLTNTQGNAAQQTQTVVTRSWPAGLPSPMSADEPLDGRKPSTIERLHVSHRVEAQQRAIHHVADHAA